ncbi:MAG: phenylalanine--tRNA ligase subunit alpha [Candidatus Omnitrophota bacterium]
MPFDLTKLESDAQSEIQEVKDPKSLEAFRVKYLGRNGLLAQAMAELPGLSAEDRPRQGVSLNNLKNLLSDLIQKKNQELITLSSAASEQDSFDLSMPGIGPVLGNKHPITLAVEEICAVFTKMGFSVVEGPEIETEFNNFTALNIPLEHPSRDVFDTFYLETQISTDISVNPRRKKHRLAQIASSERLLLRSHTSPAQIRVMRANKPPIAVIVPGKVYRPDAVDASHLFMFHQIEGLLVDKDIKFSDLKGVLEIFAKEIFGREAKVRFRPHFFPFTEPSAEVDVSCNICKGKGCSVCGKKGWLEILGSGMVHPNVFKAVGYGTDKYTGFAFGMGVERIAMLKYGIDDIRLFFENDLRFLKQF